MEPKDASKGRNSFARDRSEEALRESEARLREAELMAGLGHWRWDVATGAVQWSEGVYRIFQLDPEQFEPDINSILELSPWPEDHERDRELIERAVADRTRGSYEQRFLRPDGSTGYYFSSFQGIYDEEGGLVAMRGTVQDITERKRQEAERERLQAQYNQMQKLESLGRLAGGVAHDLNNLLMPILGYCEILLTGPEVAEGSQKPLEEIQKAGLRARDLVRQLLAYGRRQTLRYQPVDVSRVVHDMEELLRRTIPEDISIETVADPALPPVKADVGEIERVITNLAANAADAMAGGGVMRIATEFARDVPRDLCSHEGIEPGPYVHLSLADNGKGMDAKTLQHVFEPFFSTKGALGTGLGLATVYGIVRQHGGHIRVRSEPGAGTTVDVYLPVTKSAVEAAAPDAPESATDMGAHTILLVEDDPSVRELAEVMLSGLGYTVLVAEGGVEALRLLAENRASIDLLLTDVVMPDMNGRALFDEARKVSPDLRVIYMSGYAADVVGPRGVSDEETHFLQKPFRMKKLEEKLSQVLGKS